MSPMRHLDNARAMLLRVDDSLAKRANVSPAERDLLAAYRLTLAAEIAAGNPTAGTMRSCRALVQRREMKATARARLAGHLRWLRDRNAGPAIAAALEDPR